MTFDSWCKHTLGIEGCEITHMTHENQRNVNFTVSADDLINLWNGGVEDGITRMTTNVEQLETQIDKTKYALDKIIKTVQNDNISSYGDRLVKIYDISCEVLQEIKEND